MKTNVYKTITSKELYEKEDTCTKIVPHTAIERYDVNLQVKKLSAPL